MMPDDESADLTRLSEYVKSVRKRKGLRQEDITKRGGPSKGWVGTLEAGKRKDAPKLETLRRLAEALDEPFDDVLYAAGLSSRLRQFYLTSLKTMLDETWAGYLKVMTQSADLAQREDAQRAFNTNLLMVTNLANGWLGLDEDKKDLASHIENIKRQSEKYRIPVRKSAFELENKETASTINAVFEDAQSNSKSPPLDAEVGIVHSANERGVVVPETMRQRFWNLPYEERRPLLRYIEGLVDEIDRLHGRFL